MNYVLEYYPITCVPATLTSFHAGMDNFLKVVNNLQDVFSTIGASPDSIKLPQIVVVGSQSAGKSSVLESIVQRNFLPRGSGIVTRRPLIIQITHEQELQVTWGTFLHTPAKKFYDFEEIRQEIIDDTNRVCGQDKGIKFDPITLKIYSGDLPTLTLVDLPGMTKVPVGDQPQDIEQQTMELVKMYIENPNSIILAVSPGNIDLANSEAIKLAREVDPHGGRTLVVITKADLMERTKESRLVLEGKSIPIKLGIIGVINRSQAAIDNDMPVEDSLDKESIFFKTHYNYLSAEMGTPYLTKRLCQLLMEHAKECLPELIIRINDQKIVQQTILESLGRKIEDPGATIAEHIFDFCNQFSRNMEGRQAIKLLSGSQVSGGRHLFQVFEAYIGKELDRLALPENIDEQIEQEIISATGAKPSLFTPNIVFDNLAHKQIQKFTGPVKQSIKKCGEMITEVVILLSKAVFQRFPNLRREAHQIALLLLITKTNLVDDFIKNYIKCELCYINTNHRLFAKERAELESANKDEDMELTFEKRNVKKIRALLDLYINIIRNQLMDIVPKTVMCFMVYDFRDNLHRQLVKNLMDPQMTVDLMKEDELIEEKREKAEKMLNALEKADSITCILD